MCGLYKRLTYSQNMVASAPARPSRGKAVQWEGYRVFMRAHSPGGAASWSLGAMACWMCVACIQGSQRLTSSQNRAALAPTRPFRAKDVYCEG